MPAVDLYCNLKEGALFSYDHGEHAMILEKRGPYTACAKIVRGRVGMKTLLMCVDIPVPGNLAVVLRTVFEVREFKE